MSVTLNGVKVTRAVEVDDTAGTVREIVGYDQQAGKNILQTRRGVIRITVPHEHSVVFGWPPLPAKYIGRPVMAPPAGILRTR